jgi:hypothetical protein
MAFQLFAQNPTSARASRVWSGKVFASVAIATLFTWGTSPTLAKVDVLETFDVGTGTRFDNFQGNNPAPRSITSLQEPANQTVVNMGFGDETLDHSAVKTNQFGLTTTNFVGQDNGTSGAGEFGGQFNWLDYGYGADTNIGALTMGSATQADPINIKASVVIQDHAWGNDETITIGYFNENLGLNPETATLNVVGDADDMRRSDGYGLQPHTTISAGIGFIGDGRFFLYMLGANSEVFDFRYHPEPVGPGTGVIDVDLDVFCFECEGGIGTGVITGTINGNEVSFSRIAGSDNQLAAFGIGQSFRQRKTVPTDWRRSVAFVDDLTYTVETDGGIDNADPFRFELQQSGNGGDYNGDGMVDAADYTVWRDQMGATGTAGSVLGDGTSDDLLGVPDGKVDQFDYAYWKAQFGTNPGSGAFNGAGVPEPTTMTMSLCFGLASALLARRRRSDANR